MNRYEILVRILDRLRAEAPSDFSSYHPKTSDSEALNQARSKAFIHLFLKVYFGLVDFSSRHDFITEGTGDGGIDAYYIDDNAKTIYFIQSKFRQTEKNFEEKAIEPEELLAMDVSRILAGETSSESGNVYNSKIRTMIRNIKDIKDIGRYSYRVIILANAKGLTLQKKSLLTGGYHTEVFDYERCYNELVFPLISGTYFKAHELQLSLVLSDKNAGSKISYTVTTEFTECEITVVFVPTLEIARAMDKYRNSILKFNPRSYLEHHGKNVNAAIRSSIEDIRTNEFALYNNGITMLSDETFLNERIGQKDRAQLILVNPQIINGGQTAFTLSRVYREHIDDKPEQLFEGKEVLLKIITFNAGEELSKERKAALIDSISSATNKQSAVSYADRRANDPDFERLQHSLFEKLGIVLERKVGEFGDGVRDGYLTRTQVIDRNDFARMAYAIHGKIAKATKKRLIKSIDFTLLHGDDETFEKYRVGIELLRIMRKIGNHRLSAISGKFLIRLIAGVHLLRQVGASTHEALVDVARVLQKSWEEFESIVEIKNDEYNTIKTKTGVMRFAWTEYAASPNFLRDVDAFYGQRLPNGPKQRVVEQSRESDR